jgi:hypothetical protein
LPGKGLPGCVKDTQLASNHKRQGYAVHTPALAPASMPEGRADVSPRAGNDLGGAN